MENVFKELADAVAELQGQAIGNSTMLEAMLMAHPDPAKLRDCWYRISAPRIAAAATSEQTKARPADQALRYHLQKWQEKLDRHHPAAGQETT